MEVTYDYYRIFYYAAKYKSFSQAATILMSNQPNVTRAIHNLESQLGCRLFIRSNRGAELTPEGERLYSHVAIAYEHLHAAELELENEKKLEQSEVDCGVFCCVFAYIALFNSHANCGQLACAIGVCDKR